MCRKHVQSESFVLIYGYIRTWWSPQFHTAHTTPAHAHSNTQTHSMVYRTTNARLKSTPTSRPMSNPTMNVVLNATIHTSCTEEGQTDRLTDRVKFSRGFAGCKLQQSVKSVVDYKMICKKHTKVEHMYALHTYKLHTVSQYHKLLNCQSHPARQSLP